MDVIDFLSEAFWLVARPGNLFFLFLLIGAAVSWLRPGANGRIWLTTLSGVLLAVTLLPVHGWIGRPLEERFPLPDALPEAIDGIVVLGGIVRAETANQRGVLTVGDNAERIMVPAALALQYPQARLLITGTDDYSQSLVAWFSAIGLGRDRIEFEPEARNTFENALLSEQMIKPRPDEVWLLITSARHMPRAVGAFRKVRWPIIPYPVDYRSAEDEPLRYRLDLAGNLVRLGNFMKEWIGLAAYYVLDRSNELFPAPRGVE